MNSTHSAQDVIDAALADSFRMTFTQLTMCTFTFILIASVSPWFLIPFAPIMYIYWRTQRMYRMSSREIKRLDAIAVRVCSDMADAPCV